MFRIHNLQEVERLRNFLDTLDQKTAFPMDVFLFRGHKPIVGISSIPLKWSAPKVFDFLPQKDRRRECVF